MRSSKVFGLFFSGDFGF